MANPSPVSYSVASGVLRGGRWWHALAQFAATVQPGQCLEFAAPNLNSYDATEGYWFGPTPGVSGAVGPLDSSWSSCADFDPVTQRMYFAGGRPEGDSLPQKMVWYDAITDEWRSKSNWSGVRGGHLYRSTCAIPMHRRVAYEPAYTSDGVIPLWDIDSNSYAGTIPACPSAIAGGSSGWQVGSALIWHPRMGAQGSIVRGNKSLSRVVVFDWETQSWIGIGKFNDTAAWDNNHIVGHYHPLTNSVIVGASTPTTQRSLVIVEADKTTHLTAPAPCSANAGSASGQFHPHPTRRASINYCTVTKRIWTYEWDADMWVDRAPLPAALDSTSTVSSAVPSLGVILSGLYGAGGTSKTYVYRPGF